MLIAAITFVAVLSVIFGAYWFTVGDPEAREQQKLRRRLKSETPASTRAAATIQLLKQETTLSNISALNSLLNSVSGFSVPLHAFIVSSGLPLTVGTFILLSLISFFVMAIAVRYYVPVNWVVLPVALAGTFIPYLVVNSFKSRRVRKFEAQFPEAIELIARAMRAGHAFTTGIRMAADELPDPTGPEFRLLYDRQNYGAQIPDALRAFAERVPTIDARFFVTAVLTQREAGGNLSEILDRLAGVMRERFRIRQEVRTRSAHGRITAYILAAMPPVLATLLLLSNPQHMMLLVTDPLGIRLVITGVVLQIIGMLLVRKIVDIRY